MGNENLSKLEAWFAQNREKALALVQTHLADGEEVLSFAVGWDYPLDILTWIPVIGDIITMRKKRFLLAVTRQELLVIRLRTFRLEELGCEKIPVGSIRHSEVRKFPLHCNLRMELPEGKTYLFKEMPYERAAALKDAIDQAQGNPSTFG